MTFYLMGPAKTGLMSLAVSMLVACAPSPAWQPSASAVAPTSSGARTTVSVGLGGGVSPSTTSAESSPTGAELATVTQILTDLQITSFAVNAEHCGYIGLDRSNQIIVSQINRGTEASCDLPWPPAGMTLLASFHTHGTYSPFYASEFPTVTDMMSDAAEDIDGYISTPGGRLWYVDTDTMTVRQLCGRGCLPQDPNYRPEDDGPLRPVFTLADLRRFEQG